MEYGLADLAALLNVSQNVLREWIRDDKLQRGKHYTYHTKSLTYTFNEQQKDAVLRDRPGSATEWKS